MRPLNTTPHRDPAPSRVSYRFQRLWLTPLFRRAVCVGLPVLALSYGAGWYATRPHNIEAMQDKVAELRRFVEERPEFQVKLMAIDGASDTIADDIREIVPVDFPVSSFDLDLEGMKNRIAELDAVAQVDVRVRAGGILQIQIEERMPVAVWRMGRDIELLDAVGRRVAVVASRTARPQLPLLAGQGAEQHVPEALELLAAARPVASRIRGLVRMGERRWDIVLDRGQRIMLPEQDPMQALLHVMALEQTQDLLARDIIAVDMRNPNRTTLKMSPSAVEDLQRIKDDR